MTQQEIADETRRAEDLAKGVGGILAALLGLRPTEKPITWNAQRGRFVIDGRFISMQTIRRELHRFENAVAIRMANLAKLLSNGTIDLPEWRERMKTLVGSSHVIMAAVAVGSIAAGARNPEVQNRIESERKYANGFAEDVEKKKLSTPTIKARAKSYLIAAAITFAVVEMAVHSKLGYQEARRITTAAESCEDCKAYAYEWMDIGEMPEIGSLKCGNRCRCYLEYR